MATASGQGTREVQERAGPVDPSGQVNTEPRLQDDARESWPTAVIGKKDEQPSKKAPTTPKRKRKCCLLLL